MPKSITETQVDGLLRAREEYEAMGNPDALQAANKRLAALGHTDRSRAPQGRSSREEKQSTTAEPAKKRAAKKTAAKKSS